MNKIKRIAALTLAALMSASALVACASPDSGAASSTGGTASGGATSSTAGTDAPAALDYSDPTQVSKEVIKPTFMLTVGAESMKGDEIVWQAIKKATNIEFQIIPVPLASWKEKEATVLASGEIPDILACRGYTTVDKYGPQGAFLSYEDYIAKGMMPNFVSVLESMPPAMTLATSPDGKRYGSPRIYATPRMDEALLCRVDLFEKNNLSREPETFDDFYATLKKLKEVYPDSSPYFSRWETSHLVQNIAWMFHTSYTYSLGSAEAESYTFGPETQNYKDALSFMAKMYKDGLLSKDFATLTSEEYVERLISNKSFVTFDYQDTSFYEDSKNIMDEGWNWGAMLAPKYDGKRAGYPVLEGYFGYTKTISNKTKYKEELIRFMDWTYAEAGQQTLMFGIEGENYEKAADGTVKMITDIKYAGNLKGTINPHGLNDQNIFSVLPGNAAEFYENVGQFTIAQKKYLSENDAFADPIFEARFYDDKKQKEYTDIKTALNTYILEESTKVIQGLSSVEDWDKVIETAKSKFKAEEGLALINAAFVETFKK